MEEGTKSKKTVFVGGIGEEVDEAIIYENFSTFGAFLSIACSRKSNSTPPQEI